MNSMTRYAVFSAVCVFVPVVSAQPEDAVPLRNWPAPLLWHPPASLDRSARLDAVERLEGGRTRSGKAQDQLRAAASSDSGAPREAAISGALAFVAVTPCRFLDTRPDQGRTGQFGPPFLAANTERPVNPTASACGIPAGAFGYSLNVTVLPLNTMQFLSLYPTGTPFPGVSSVNAPNGGIVANAAIVPAGTGGQITMFASSNTEVILDINGYYTETAERATSNSGAISLVNNNTRVVTATCSAGKTVKGGGCYASQNAVLSLTTAGFQSTSEWVCAWKNDSGSTVNPVTLYADAFCAP